MSKTIKIKLVRSRIKASKHQEKVLDGLNLRKINTVRELQDTPSIRGMVDKVSHLVEVIG